MILKDSKLRLHKKDMHYEISMLLKLDRFSIVFKSPEMFTLYEATQRMIDLSKELDICLNIKIEEV